MAEKRIYHPIQDDYVTFLESAAECERTLLEVEVAPGGGTSPHFHTRFAETLTAVSGDLSVLVAEDVVTLSPGETVRVDIGVVHRFFNDSAAPVTFHVDIRPGNLNFERALRVAYGLARDGKTNAKGIPKNPLELAVLSDWSNTMMSSSTAAFLRPVFGYLLKLAKYLGVDKRLLEAYC